MGLQIIIESMWGFYQTTLQAGSCSQALQRAANTITRPLAMAGCEEVPFGSDFVVFMVISEIQKVFAPLILACTPIRKIEYLFRPVSHFLLQVCKKLLLKNTKCNGVVIKTIRDGGVSSVFEVFAFPPIRDERMNCRLALVPVVTLYFILCYD